MRSCANCLLPDTRINITIFPDGICSACKSYEFKKTVDFEVKKTELLSIVKKSRKHPKYDCIIPVSGGKDSTYQVIKVLELGITPLCVCVLPDLKSSSGERNLANLKELGVDLIEVSVSKSISTPIMREAFLQTGSVLWFEIVCISLVPIKISVEKGIPLVLWGENPALEDGYPLEGGGCPISLPNKPIKLSGVELFGLARSAGVAETELTRLLFPNHRKQSSQTLGYYLGDFVRWDRLGNAVIAQQFGFKGSLETTSVSALPYENLDNPYFGIQNYLSYLRSGVSNLNSVYSYLIRRNIVGREDVVRLLNKEQDVFPHRYLEYSLEELLAPLDLTLEDFHYVCRNLLNRSIFLLDGEEEFVRKHPFIAT